MNELSPVKQAVLAISEMRARLQQLEGAVREPIAITGMGCRFPGGVHDEESYWELLESGRIVVRETPANRWDLNLYYDPDPEAPGRMNTRHGAFIDDLERFDAAFFGISPREAGALDPQQRMLLEVAWEALENSGYPPDEFSRSRTAVYVGAMNHDYLHRQLAAGDPLGAYAGTGSGASFLAGRLSYYFGFQGPSLAIDTACSSALVAIHLGCQALRNRDCDMALAGGVNVILTPQISVALSKFKALSPSGRCSPFDAAADGFVRGEGCGLVVLKRLSDAVAHGDRILAVIRGSAVNHGGPSSGLTVPYGASQTAVIEEAMANAGVSAADIDYLETHGTGTKLGDPIEYRAFTTAYRGRRALLPAGSVKANLGHLESAAGVASLLKTVLALQHGRIPPNPHFHRFNPHIEAADFPVEFPVLAVSSRLRMAGVSSFGMSGVNAHMVVEAASLPAAATSPTDTGEYALSVSAKTRQALDRLRLLYREFLDSHPDCDLGDFCFTATAGRARLLHSTGGIVRSKAEAQALLAGPVQETDLRWKGPQRRRIAIPTYPWEDTRYWLSARPAPMSASWTQTLVWTPADLPRNELPSVDLSSGRSRRRLLINPSPADELIAWDAIVQEGGIVDALNLAQRLLRLARPPEVWWICRGEDTDGISGFVRSFAAEHPHIEAHLLRVDKGEDLAPVLNLVCRPGAPLECAWRDGQFLTPSFVPTAIPRAAGLSLKRHRCYLVTGGCGAVGLAVGEILARAGAGRVVLAGRKEPTPAAAERIASMRSAVYTSCDLADSVQVAGLARQNFAGIVHCAGTLDDALVSDLTAERMESVFRGKVRGAWNLHRALTDQGLMPDFFVLFSSAAAALGSAGQSNYAAANAALDALAQIRRAAGQPAVSINWGPWQNTGMAAGIRVRGIETIPVNSALMLLEDVLQYPAPPRVLAFSVRKAKSRSTAPRDTKELVSEIVARILELPAGVAPDPDLPFRDMGFDSLSALELRNELAARTGKDLRATATFDYATISRLAEHLEDLSIPVETPGADSGVRLGAHS